MKVATLIEQLQKLPPYMEVHIMDDEYRGFVLNQIILAPCYNDVYLVDAAIYMFNPKLNPHEMILYTE